MSAAATLRQAAKLVEQAATEATAKGYEYAGIGDRGDEWAALLTVPVAGPLAAWLRAEAASADAALAFMVERQLPSNDRIEERHKHPLALARAILGEPT